MLVRYIGPCADPEGVVIEDGQTVVRGDVVTVDDVLGLRLCEQVDNWAADGDESVALFVGFCRWVQAVQVAEEAAGADTRHRPSGEPLPNPGLAALAEPTTEPAAPARGRRRSADQTVTTEEG